MRKKKEIEELQFLSANGISRSALEQIGYLQSRVDFYKNMRETENLKFDIMRNNPAASIKKLQDLFNWIIDEHS